MPSCGFPAGHFFLNSEQIIVDIIPKCGMIIAEAIIIPGIWQFFSRRSGGTEKDAALYHVNMV